MKESDLADVWVVAGAPGCGKSTVASLLIKMLNPHPALLDKDTMYEPFVISVLEKANKSYGEREGDWYDVHIKVHEYLGMTATAREIRSHGCPVLLSGPFTKQIHKVEVWRDWIAQLGGGNVNLVWVFIDKDSLKKRLEARGLERDSKKLERFEVFVDYMQLDSAPPFPHIKIDNSENVKQTLETQLESTLL